MFSHKIVRLLIFEMIFLVDLETGDFVYDIIVLIYFSSISLNIVINLLQKNISRIS